MIGVPAARPTLMMMIEAKMVERMFGRLADNSINE